jgi:hypothetical protein
MTGGSAYGYTERRAEILLAGRAEKKELKNLKNQAPNNK